MTVPSRIVPMYPVVSVGPFEPRAPRAVNVKTGFPVVNIEKDTNID